MFHFSVSHEEFNGVQKAEVRFHAESYALQIDPGLQNVKFPNEAPRGVALKPAAPPTPPEPPPEASGPVASTPPVPPASDAIQAPIGKPEDISDEEFAEAIRIAKQIHEGKKD